jgi:heptosyltransferase-3
MRFLLIKLGHLGDSLLMTPTLHHLRERHPQAQIDVVVRRGSEALLEGNPDLDRLLLAPAPARERRAARGQPAPGFGRTLWAVLGRRYDFAFDLSNSDRARLLLLVSGAKVRAANNAYGDLRHPWLYQRQSKFLWGERHQVEKDFITVTDALGEPAEPGPLRINTEVDTDDLRERLPFLRDPRPFAVIHPTSRWTFKQWLPDRWAAVADQLTRQHGLRVLLSCGPGAREADDLEAILRRSRESHHALRGAASLRELAWIISQARLFCGVDTVAMHIAAAVQAPTVALFGPSSEWSWRPWQARHELALGDCPCKQTRKFVCDKSQPYPCMERITVEQVQGQIQRLLAP